MTKPIILRQHSLDESNLVGRVSCSGILEKNESATAKAEERLKNAAERLGASHLVITTMRTEPDHYVAYGDAYRI